MKNLPILTATLYGDTVKLVPTFGMYGNERVAIGFDDAETGECWSSAVTVNMPHDHLNDGEVFIKDWSENEDMVKALVKEGWLIPTGRETSSGFVNPKVMKPAGPLLEAMTALHIRAKW